MIFRTISKNYQKLILVIVLFPLLSGCSNVVPTGYDFTVMMDTLRSNFPAVVRLLVAVAYLSGIWFVYSAIHKLRAYGEARTMMPSNAQFAGPMLQFAVGVLLIFLPSVVNISMYSLWGNDDFAGIDVGAGSDWASVEAAVVGIVQILGYVAFIRGLIMMARAGQQGTQPGMLGKGITHLVGGIFAINIIGTIGVIEASIGLIT